MQKSSQGRDVLWLTRLAGLPAAFFCHDLCPYIERGKGQMTFVSLKYGAGYSIVQPSDAGEDSLLRREGRVGHTNTNGMRRWFQRHRNHTRSMFWRCKAKTDCKAHRQAKCKHSRGLRKRIIEIPWGLFCVRARSLSVQVVDIMFRQLESVTVASFRCLSRRRIASEWHCFVFVKRGPQKTERKSNICPPHREPLEVGARGFIWCHFRGSLVWHPVTTMR